MVSWLDFGLLQHMGQDRCPSSCQGLRLVYIHFDDIKLITDWGDFFFLVDQSLTFDGVFEMAPHPMYIPSQLS